MGPEEREAELRNALDANNKLQSQKVNFRSKYKLVKEIGRGGFGTVHTCTETSSNVMFAVKIIDKNKCAQKNKKALELLKKEILTIQEAHHPNIVKAQELCEDNTNFYIVMEYVKDGSLTKLQAGKA